MYHFHRRTAEPFGPSSARGYDKPTSRCQTIPLIRALGNYQPVIPGVPLIRCAKAFPPSTSGSLKSTYVSARCVNLAVRHSSTFMLLPSSHDRESTFIQLCYFFRVRRPSETTQYTMSRISTTRWENARFQCGITFPLSRVPHILYKNTLLSMHIYSKGAQGLTV